MLFLLTIFLFYNQLMTHNYDETPRLQSIIFKIIKIKENSVLSVVYKLTKLSIKKLTLLN